MSKEVKLHLGCEKFIPGFIHIDAMKHPHVDYVQDISNLNNFSDESVDLYMLAFLNTSKEMILKEF